MSNWTSAAFGMRAIAPTGGVVFACASQRGRMGAIAGHGYAKQVDALGVPATIAVRAGADLTVDVPGARAWSPPV